MTLAIGLQGWKPIARKITSHNKSLHSLWALSILHFIAGNKNKQSHLTMYGGFTNTYLMIPSSSRDFRLSSILSITVIFSSVVRLELFNLRSTTSKWNSLILSERAWKSIFSGTWIITFWTQFLFIHALLSINTRHFMLWKCRYVLFHLMKLSDSGAASFYVISKSNSSGIAHGNPTPAWLSCSRTLCLRRFFHARTVAVREYHYHDREFMAAALPKAAYGTLAWIAH